MKAYLIDTKYELITEVDVKDYYHKLELLNCRMLELYPRSINGNDIWVDEEGNLKEIEDFFKNKEIERLLKRKQNLDSKKQRYFILCFFIRSFFMT